MFTCKMISEKLNIEQAMLTVEDANYGAQAVFVGRVRAINHGKIVTAVAYDSFSPLAEKSFVEICHQAKIKFSEDLKATVFHRIGRLEVGEASIVVAVGTRHRDLAYKVSRFILEEIKVRSPIWKKEFYITGETEWLKGHSLCEKDHSHPLDV